MVQPMQVPIAAGMDQWSAAGRASPRRWFCS